MDNLFLLSEVQMHRIKPFFPLSHGVPRVDDRRSDRSSAEPGIVASLSGRSSVENGQTSSV